MFPNLTQPAEPKPVKWEDTVKRILPNTPEMEAFLAVGYNLNVADAEAIVEAGTKNRNSVAPQDLKNARAFLEAYHTASKPVAKRDMIVPKPTD